MRARAMAPSIAAMTLALSIPARADDARKSDAKAIATRGDGEFYAGRCDRAIPLWREAEAAYHAPTILLRIARCEAILGRISAAAAMLEAIGREALDGDAPPAFFTAREQARREAPLVRARVAAIEIAVDAGERAPVVIEIDGEAPRARGPVFEVDPGERSIRVRTGASSWQSTMKLRDGERVSMRVSLSAEPEPRSPRIQRALGVAAIATGGAAAALGVGLSIGGAQDRAPRALGVAGKGALAAGSLLAVAGGITIATVPSRGDAWRVKIGAASVAIEARF